MTTEDISIKSQKVFQVIIYFCVNVNMSTCNISLNLAISFLPLPSLDCSIVFDVCVRRAMDGIVLMLYHLCQTAINRTIHSYANQTLRNRTKSMHSKSQQIFFFFLSHSSPWNILLMLLHSRKREDKLSKGLREAKGKVKETH